MCLSGQRAGKKGRSSGCRERGTLVKSVDVGAISGQARKGNGRVCGRNRRPPLDRVNAMLSFAYSLLTNDCASALSAAGLDAYVGFMHQDRPGRTSLALDLMEELRAPLCDRFVIALLNRGQIKRAGFEHTGNEFRLSDQARRLVISEWQQRKKETITHPFLKEKIPIGLIPYCQAMLLARHLRGDLAQYPPYLWR